MKKITIVLLIVFAVSQQFADVNFYGAVRMGWWYQLSDKDFTGNVERTDIYYDLYTDSRIGFDFTNEDYQAKVEMKITPTDVGLREAWLEYDFGSVKVLVGRAMSGFADYASQVYDVDRCLRGYGMMWDNYNTQIRFTMNDAYLILASPLKNDPAFLGSDKIDVLVPKINVGKKFNFGRIYFHPTLGINYCRYNDELAYINSIDTTDESVLSYVVSATLKYDLKIMSFKFQATYGQNIGDYGMIKPKKGTQGVAQWDYSTNEVIDSQVFSGYLEAKYYRFTLGLGYISENNDTLNDPDAAASAFLQYRYDLRKNFCLIPEIGILDHFENGFGLSEGTITYFGTTIRTSF